MLLCSELQMTLDHYVCQGACDEHNEGTCVKQQRFCFARNSGSEHVGAASPSHGRSKADVS